jgi:predicted nucleic acid-binding protein
LIAYLDSSVLVRSYLPDEDGHADVSRILDDPDIAAVTGSLTRVEVSGALVRAASAGRGNRDGLLKLLDFDLGEGGVVTVLKADQAEVEETALKLVRKYALRALDALHLAVAQLAVPPLAELRETIAFVSRDGVQASVAVELGFDRL